jgi:hypothetical protein
LQPFLPPAKAFDFKALFAEVVADELDNVSLILDEHHLGTHSHIISSVNQNTRSQPRQARMPLPA